MMLKEPTKIFITGFPTDIRNQNLKNLFDHFGRILFYDINKGAGCIIYESERGANNAVNKMDNTYFFGQKIYVELIPSQRPNLHKKKAQSRYYSESSNSYSKSRSRSRSRSYQNHKQKQKSKQYQPQENKKKKPNSRDKCYVCGKHGHWATQCPVGDGAGVSSGKCFRCGQKGHIARECPKFLKERNQKSDSVRKSKSFDEESNWKTSSSKSSLSSKSYSKSKQRSSSSSQISASFSKSKSKQKKS